MVECEITFLIFIVTSIYDDIDIKIAIKNVRTLKNLTTPRHNATYYP